MKKLLSLTVLMFTAFAGFSTVTPSFISNKKTFGSFPIVTDNKIATLVVSDTDWIGVKRAVQDLQSDLEKVSSLKPEIANNIKNKEIILIGTIGKSPLIDELIANKKINASGITGKWESTLIETVDNPFPGVNKALVIAGSDKRGTIYGIYEVAQQSGVSPWYYWADVPVKTSKELHVKTGRHVISSPAVKYRGIFLNDEAPALSGWSRKEFGGFNHKFYEKVFELILRLKGNFLWPAMWGSAFNDDDKLNPIVADDYGVVIGTSHHEPLARAHDEWRRYGSGKWDYTTNESKLKDFWKTGFDRIKDKEQLITLGMRGDGDEPMTEGTATALLEKIVKDQRNIIESSTGKPAEETPQVWALYKEVQDYYDKGMRVPDDVTLLLCDDNWGNIRKLPKLGEKPRKGGYGIYYHFDYVGDPRNYKWINTNPIQKTWEQMNLAYHYDANQIWIVNVGDLKPMEFPISFFLDFAWDPNAIPAEKLQDYMVNWSKQQFGEKHASEIGDLIDKYSKYNGRIKPELLDASTYSLVNYNEFENVVKDYNDLVERAEFINKQIPAKQKDAFYQLVLHPITASANLNELYLYVAKNRLYAKQKRNNANYFATKAKELYNKDSLITDYYNNQMANGKWKHMMDQTHIGYTYWQQPEKNAMPATTTITVGNKAEMGVAIEGDTSSWTGKTTITGKFPEFDSYSNAQHYFEIFNTGNSSFNYTIKSPSYINLSKSKGEITAEERILVQINWAKAPKGNSKANIIVTGLEGSKINIPVILNNYGVTISEKVYVQQNGYISIEAPNYSKAVNSRPIFWKTIPGFGSTLGGVMVSPVTSAAITNFEDGSPHLQYDVYINKTGTFNLHSYIAPTIDFANSQGLRFAVSVDDSEPIIVNISEEYRTEEAWRKSVANNIKIFKTPLTFNKTGKHTIKYWMVDAAVVLQKLVLDAGGLKESYLGPQQTFIK